MFIFHIKKYRKIYLSIIIICFSFIASFIIIENKEVKALDACYNSCRDCMTPAVPIINLASYSGSEETVIGIFLTSNGSTEAQCPNWFNVSGSYSGTLNTSCAYAGYATENYNHTGLAPGTQYSYSARACRGGCQACTGFGDDAYCEDTPDTCSSYSGNSSKTTSFFSPSSLNATCGTTDADLTWNDNSSAETGYKIYLGGSLNATVATINLEAYTVGGLVENHSYDFFVKAYHSSGSLSGASNTDSCTTGVISPNTFTATASATSTTQINLTWNDRSSVEDGYKVERATGVCSSFAQIGTTTANVEAYGNAGLLNGTTYCYRVRAYDGGADSSYSSTASATTAMPAPTNLSGVAVSQTQIDLVWSDNSNSETGFKVERANNSDCSGTPSFSQIGTTGSGITSYSNTGLTSNTSYCYRVRSYTAYADSAYSSTVTISTSLPSPTNLTATASATSTTQINLTWTDNSNNENRFELERKTGASGIYVNVANVATNTTAYANTGVLDGTIYYYRARACNALACSSYSNEASATTVLVAPTNLTCTPISSSQINLAWADNSTSETGFTIERNISSPPSTVIFTTGQNAITYSNENLSENTLYYYRIRAYNANSGVYSGYTNICGTSTPIYVPTGNMTSSIFDTSKVGGVAFNNILWKGTQPSDSHVLFHFASSNSTSTFNFIGPDGTSATYYQSSGSNTVMNISTRYHNNHRYFRYKAYIYPNSSNESPQITDIVIGYSP
jgi:titin